MARARGGRAVASHQQSQQPPHPLPKPVVIIRRRPACPSSKVAVAPTLPMPAPVIMKRPVRVRSCGPLTQLNRDYFAAQPTRCAEPRSLLHEFEAVASDAGDASDHTVFDCVDDSPASLSRFPSSLIGMSRNPMAVYLGPCP